jgi:hypothetical protein
MHRLSILIAALTLMLAAGCNTAGKPVTATTLEPKIREKIGKGVVEPGFTPEMVYLALGKPTEPAQSIADATTNGTWIYNDFHRNDRDFVQAGFRRRVVSDPTRKGDVIVTEPIDPKSIANVRPHSLYVTFRDGRVVEIQHVAEI